jgi:hypothetical protein
MLVVDLWLPKLRTKGLANIGCNKTGGIRSPFMMYLHQFSCGGSLLRSRALQLSSILFPVLHTANGNGYYVNA